MDEEFDWLSNSLETIKETVAEIIDFEFIDILEDIESDGQDRDSIREILQRRTKDIKFELYGFDLNLIDLLLNHLPFYDPEKTKEPYTKEMREFIYERDDFECRLCHSSWNGLQCHHIEPQGSASGDNLITLCKKCHEIIHRLLRNKKYPYSTPGRY